MIYILIITINKPFKYTVINIILFVTNQNNWRVHFSPGTTVLKLNTTATIGVRTKFSNSHHAARIAHGAFDFAATANFLPMTYRGTDHQDTSTGIRVGCANGSVVRAVATDEIIAWMRPNVQSKHSRRTLSPFAVVPIPTFPRTAGTYSLTTPS